MVAIHMEVSEGVVGFPKQSRSDCWKGSRSGKGINGMVYGASQRSKASGCVGIDGLLGSLVNFVRGGRM